MAQRAAVSILVACFHDYRRMNMMRWLIAACLVTTLAACAEEAREQPTPSPNDWLLMAKDDDERMRLIQTQLRGFDQPMWEVGERFERMHAALSRNNPQLAAYHWEKIRTSIENGTAKRPARRANAEALFLTPVWPDVDAALKSGDANRAWAGFTRAKDACHSCHAAEKVAFMNDQPLFELSSPAPAAR